MFLDRGGDKHLKKGGRVPRQARCAYARAPASEETHEGGPRVLRPRVEVGLGSRSQPRRAIWIRASVRVEFAELDSSRLAVFCWSLSWPRLAARHNALRGKRERL